MAYVLEYENGWGTRLPRSYRRFYFERKPTIDEAVEVLRANISPAASAEWLASHNAGLVTIKALTWTALPEPLQDCKWPTKGEWRAGQPVPGVYGPKVTRCTAGDVTLAQPVAKE